VEVFLQGQDKLFYKAGIQKLQKRWNKCIEVGGYYVKNKLVTVAVSCFFIYEAGNFWNNPRMTCKKHLMQTWVDFGKNVIEAVTDQWHDRLRSCVSTGGRHFKHIL